MLVMCRERELFIRTHFFYQYSSQLTMHHQQNSTPSSESGWYFHHPPISIHHSKETHRLSRCLLQPLMAAIQEIHFFYCVSDGIFGFGMQASLISRLYRISQGSLPCNFSIMCIIVSKVSYLIDSNEALRQLWKILFGRLHRKWW